MLKSLFKPLYRKVIAKLRNSLHLDEHTRLLNHIIVQNEILQKDREILSRQLYMLSVLIGGIEPPAQNGAFTTTPEDTAQDIVNILSPVKMNDIESVQMLNSLDGNFFKNKSICLIGTQNAFIQKELLKRAASKVVSLELISHLAYEHKNEDTVYVYPSHVGTVNIPDKTDIIFVTHPAACNYLLKRRLFGLGTKITKNGLFVLSGTDEDRKRLESLITASGFNQVQKVPQGTIARFDYVDLRAKPEEKKEGEVSTSLYIAHKLPVL